MRNSVREKLKELGDFDLHTAPADILVEAVEKTGIQSWFLQVDAPLEDWQIKTGNNAQRLLLSDVQNEVCQVKMLTHKRMLSNWERLPFGVQVCGLLMWMPLLVPLT